MIITDQNQISSANGLMHLGGIENRLIRAVRRAEVFKILSPPVGIVGTDLAFYTLQRMQLRS